jgi:hypothetical protein
MSILNKEQKAYKEIDIFLKTNFKANDYILKKDNGEVEHFKNSYIIEFNEVGSVFIRFEVNTNHKPYTYCIFTRFIDRGKVIMYNNNYFDIKYSCKRNHHFIEKI